MRLSDIAMIINGQLQGADANFENISTDTRKLKAGDLFFALKGVNFDANNFVQEATHKGAAGAVVNRFVDIALPQIKVQDTLEALGKYAAYHRQQFSIPVIGITGSCGKTTSKTMLANILQLVGDTVIPEGTFNNAVGVPLTLLRITPQHKFAIVEMGTNHFGEIHYIAQMTSPTIALITNAAAAHLAAFGNVANVAKEKGEIYQALSKDGIAIINADDEFASYWQSLLSSQRILRFGIKNSADITAKNITLDNTGRPQFILITPDNEIEIRLSELGLHNVMNALAAASAAYALNVPITAIKKGLAATSNVGKRLVERAGYNNALIIDDSYNGTPPSFSAALSVLAAKKGERILVMGDMFELGEHAEDYHRELGLAAKQQGIDALYAFGELSSVSAEAFGDNAYYYRDLTALITTLRNKLHKNMVVLVKGSRGMRMERVVEALLATDTVSQK